MNQIILADTYGVFRTGTAVILSREEDIHVVLQCREIGGLQSALSEHHGIIVLFNSAIAQNPGMLMRQIRTLGHRGVAMLGIGESTQAYLEAHVHGLFFRSATAASVLACVRSVGRGENAIQLGTSAILDEDPVGASIRDRLKPKEMKILGLVMKGYSNKEIAFLLLTSEQVIKNFLRGMYDKIGVSDRLELAIFTIHHRHLAEASAAVGNRIVAAVEAA